MKAFVLRATLALSALVWSSAAFAAETASRQPNVPAIVMFLVFVSLTLIITYWAAKRTRTASDFYAAGRGITGTQNGLAIAGDLLSAATLLGISSLIFAKGYDGYLYCLESDTGSLVWKFRGGPSDRRILGNERIISTWPARGAPHNVVHHG